jgi:hypothetical protein
MDCDSEGAEKKITKNWLHDTKQQPNLPQFSQNKLATPRKREQIQSSGFIRLKAFFSTEPPNL